MATAAKSKVPAPVVGGVNCFGYIKNHGSDGYQALVVSNTKHTDKKHYKLLDDGWAHVIDNFYPSIEVCYDVMEAGVVTENNQEVHAYKEYCRVCGWFMPVYHVVGQLWNDYRQRANIFNGKACEQCQQEFLVIKHNGANMAPTQRDSEVRREYLRMIENER